MIDYNFISDEIYLELPEEAGPRFLALSDAALNALHERLPETQAGTSTDSLKRAYMKQVDAIAHELGLGTLPTGTSSVTPGEWREFNIALTALKTRIKLRLNAGIARDTVSLGRISKARIAQEIDRLRRIVEASDLDVKKKEALYYKLDELTEELNRSRMSFAKLAAIAASIAAILGGSTTALAQAPEAKETIMKIFQWVGEERHAEEEERAALTSPPKALPPPNERNEE